MIAGIELYDLYLGIEAYTWPRRVTVDGVELKSFCDEGARVTL